VPIARTDKEVTPSNNPDFQVEILTALVPEIKLPPLSKQKRRSNRLKHHTVFEAAAVSDQFGKF